MRILHLLPNANKSVTENYVKFVRDNFNNDEHIFYRIIYLGLIKNEVCEQVNVELIPYPTKRDILVFFDQYDKIIIHYLCFKTTLMLRLLFRPNVFKKIVWVAWGADLYQWKTSFDGSILNKFKILVKNTISFAFRRNIRCFVGIFPPDIDYFKKEFKSSAKTFYASYVGSIDSDFFYENIRFPSLADKTSKNACINVQIGHSSSKVLNHLEVLERLSKFKNENLKIFIPLSYGDKEYGDLVERASINIFGDKAICIKDMMSKDDYMKFLSNMDIVIFNTNRQIGLGNIIPLLFMEKKLFIPESSVMYEFFKSHGVNICNYNDLNPEDFNNFTKPIDMSAGKEYIISNELRNDNKVKMWSKVFEATLE